jgi:hypothetical protein
MLIKFTLSVRNKQNGTPEFVLNATSRGGMLKKKT